MNKRILPTCLALALLVSCALPQKGGRITEPFCETNGLEFHTDFESAALHGCAATGDGPLLTIAPEFAPINPSPWYAWRVTRVPNSSGKPGKVTITQRYLHGWHRYHPWTSVDGEDWRRLPDAQVSVVDKVSVKFLLDLPPQGLYVAAQPPLTTTAMDQWVRDLAATHGLIGRQVALSVGGRPVNAFETDLSKQRGSLVLVSRQHPPEVTGGLAYQEFVERLFARDELARRFREHFAVGLVPEINPDGVARGYWRTNQRGVDLNRDWGPFTQPETQGVADWMARLHEQAPLRLFMDFHSTSHDVFYMPHRDDDPAPHGFTPAWRNKLARRLGDAMPAWSGEHNPGLPTSKTWVRKQYGVIAMTYEVGDNTPRDRIREVAVAAAEELMQLMLEIGVPGT